jgi:hypothetical protein
MQRGPNAMASRDARPRSDRRRFAPRRSRTVIGPSGFYLDFSVHKDFRMPKEGHILQFRMEASIF